VGNVCEFAIGETLVGRAIGPPPKKIYSLLSPISHKPEPGQNFKHLPQPSQLTTCGTGNPIPPSALYAI